MKFFVFTLLILVLGFSAKADPNEDTSFDGALVDQKPNLEKVAGQFGTASCGECDAAQKNQRKLTTTITNATTSSGTNQGSQGNQ